MHTHIHGYIHTYMYISMLRCVQRHALCVCVCVYVCMCPPNVYTSAYTYAYTHAYTNACTYLYICASHTHTLTHPPTLPHTHTHSGKRLPVGHFALAAMSLLGVRPSELREVLVKAKVLTSFLSMIAYSKYTRVLILENSVSVLFLPDRAAAPPECLGCVTSVTSFKRWGSPLLSLLSPVEECPAIVRGRRRGRRGL